MAVLKQLIRMAKNKFINTALIGLTLLISNSVKAQNPIIGIPGISDPHVRVFNNKIYLYSGHDDKPTDTTWVMKDWRVFSTSDLVNWKQETVISPKDNYMGATLQIAGPETQLKETASTISIFRTGKEVSA